jgi:hypothetical protein
MRVTIVAVHPTITIIKHDTGQLEVPTLWFPTTPKVGQVWTVNFEHQPTDQEKLDQLNTYLVRD